MKESIFRKKAVDRISSPEQINDCIKVTKVSVWLVLAAIVCILVAILIWSITAKLQVSVRTDSEAGNYMTTEEDKGIEKIKTQNIAPIDLLFD